MLNGHTLGKHIGKDIMLEKEEKKLYQNGKNLCL